MAMKVLMMPTPRVGQGTHLVADCVPVWTGAPVVSGLDMGRAARVQVAEREGSPVVGGSGYRATTTHWCITPARPARGRRDRAALMRAETTPGRRARRLVGSLSGAPLPDQLGVGAGAGYALASRSPHHEIRGLGWDDEVLHVTVFNRRHHLMELA